MDAWLNEAVTRPIEAVGTAVDVAGVAIIVVGIASAAVQFLRRYRLRGADHYKAFKVRTGRSLLLGLELLVAADIIKTVALVPTFQNIGVLAVLIVIRTFLSWTLELETEGRWPWQPESRVPPEGPAV